MGSRHISVQQHNNIGEGVLVPMEGKQNKNAVVGGGRNRRALGDIGNLVTMKGVEGAKQAQISRPATRSFCQQLLANAQAAAENNNKKPVCVNLEGANAAAKRGVKAAQKKPTVAKPPVEVIEISPDTEVAEVKKKEENAYNVKKIGQGSAKKKVHSLTSVLSARSKAACGLTNKPKIIDFDAADTQNELAVVEYVEDIYKFYKEIENESRACNYMGSQPEINEKMRAILIDWLTEVHHKFELMPETLYLTINIVDRFLATKVVPRRELQLVGISAMLMASKYEEIWAPEVNDFVCISDRAYTPQQILVMEKTILGNLEWTLTVATPYVFLVRFIKAAIPDKDMENMAYFLAELGMLNYATMVYCPSILAASAVYAARCTLNKTPVWNATLQLHTGYSESQLMDCAKLLVGYHSIAPESKLKVVYKKYADPEKGAVAMLPVAKSLLATTGGSSAHC